MDRIARFLLCSCFLWLYFGNTSAGAKKKKDLETIVEVRQDLQLIVSFVLPLGPLGFADSRSNLLRSSETLILNL